MKVPWQPFYERGVEILTVVLAFATLILAINWYERRDEAMRLAEQLENRTPKITGTFRIRIPRVIDEMYQVRYITEDGTERTLACGIYGYRTADEPRSAILLNDRGISAAVEAQPGRSRPVFYWP